MPLMNNATGWVAEAKAKAATAANAAALQGLLASMLVGVECHENRLGNTASARAVQPVAVGEASK
jgi:hypothetical protein